MKGNFLVFAIAMIAFGFIWWGLKPVLDAICVSMFASLAAEMNMSAQELAWWGFVPIMIFVIIVTGYTVRFLRHRQGGGQ